MESLQPKHIAPYLLHGLNIVDVRSNQVITMTALNTKDKISDNFKPLLVPLSEMINLMEKFLCDLCLFDLSDCIFHCEYDETEHSYYVNASYIDEVRASLIWNGNVFEIYYNDHSENDKFDTYSPQINALNLFYKYHIDINELIDAGLALNKLDYMK